jgi:hypothetical protein
MVGNLGKRINYYRRIFKAYLSSEPSQLTFWHETPEMSDFTPGHLGPYYMPFTSKANYSGKFDDYGIPLLNYHGAIGLQYNPIAIAQYGLGNYNLYQSSECTDRRTEFLTAADWLVATLKPNHMGLQVWNHDFDWDYRSTLKAPWYSGLAQGQGISLLVRAFLDTEDTIYLSAAEAAAETFLHSTAEGGVVYTDSNGGHWFEEYIVSPPTHILNGFIWASWGVYDLYLLTRRPELAQIFTQAVATMVSNLPRYDAGFWSLYEQSGTRLPMLASPFYHRLHIIQLRVMHLITGEDTFRQFAAKWDMQINSRVNRARAVVQKSLFKLCYY